MISVGNQIYTFVPLHSRLLRLKTIVTLTVVTSIFNWPKLCHIQFQKTIDLYFRVWFQGDSWDWYVLQDYFLHF